MKAIGGFFELELNNFGEYHKNAIRLNTGRNALEYVLKCFKFNKIYIPYYTCDVILEPINKLNLKYEFYNINDRFEPLISNINKGSAILYTNYFGICDAQVGIVTKKFNNVIIDNCQSFFSVPDKKAVATFYSCRKFFGVPDGAYLYIKKTLRKKLDMDISEKRISHLIKRIEFGPEKAYLLFKKNDYKLKNQPIRNMSSLTRALMANIDYTKVKQKRRQNFLYLHERLHKYNDLIIDYKDYRIPMIYPFLVNYGSKIKEKLIDNRIYVATYWPNVKMWTKCDSFEHYLAENLVSLPIDQRYNLDDLKIIISVLNG